MAKLVKHESGIDRLSVLPDSVLSRILSLLPTKFAVRTSILSTRWRYLYTSVTTLDFDDNGNLSDSFMNFVDRVLFFLDTRTCIERFRLRCGTVDENVDASRICGWISLALRRRLQELDLQIYSRDATILPACLFTSKTLVKLVLHGDFVVVISSKICIPSLKALHLELVDFVDEDSMGRLFSGCPVLEELVICYRPWDNIRKINVSNTSLKRLTIDSLCPECEVEPLHIAIDAPSLVDIKFSMNLVESYSLVNLHSLVKAHLTAQFDPEDELVNQENAANLLRGISNVQSLCVSADFFMLLNFCEKPLPLFYNLVLVEICDGWCYDWGGTGLAELFESAPNLETLIFDGTASKYLSQYQYEKVRSSLLSHLKVIEIYWFQGEMKLVEFFLKNASVLEKLKIQMPLHLQVEEKIEIFKKLLMLPRESKATNTLWQQFGMLSGQALTK